MSHHSPDIAMASRAALLMPFLVVLSTVPVAGQANLQVDGGLRFSFGSIYRGQVMEQKVTLRNTGTDTLKITGVNASCGCTGTIIDSPQLAPGKSGTLAITFNSKNFSGEVHKTVTIQSTSADNPVQVIEFTATVIDEILYSPPQFWFKDAEVGRLCRSTVKLTNKGKEPLVLKVARLTVEDISLLLPAEPLKPGAEIELVLEYTPKKPTSFLSEGVFIATSNPRRPEIYIPIYGNAKEFKFE
jgi:hypothetical protein